MFVNDGRKVPLEVKDELALPRLGPLFQVDHVRQNLLVRLLSFVGRVRFVLINLTLEAPLVFIESRTNRRHELLLNVCDQVEGSLLDTLDLQFRLPGSLADKALAVVFQSIKAVAELYMLAA